MATNDVYELALFSTLLNQQIVNRVHFQANAGVTPDATSALALADDFRACLTAANLASSHLATKWTLRQVWGAGVTYSTTKPIRSGGLYLEGVPTTAAMGSDGANQLVPLQVAACMKLTTGYLGRRRRGRLFIAGLTVTDLASGLIAAGTVTQINASFTTMNNKYKPGGTSADWDWGVFSFRAASGWAPSNTWPRRLVYVGPISTQNEFTGFTTFSLDTTPRTQRRREIGVGL